MILRENTRQKIVNVSLLIYTLSLVLNNLVIGKFFSSELHWLGFLVGLVLWLMFIHKFAMSDPQERISWLKQNVLVFLFLAVGLVNLLQHHFAYSAIRSLFVESIYLVLVTDYLCDQKYIKRVIFRVFIYINLAMNLLPFLVNVVAGFQRYNVSFIKNLFFYTYLDSRHASPFSMFYSNPNAMGIMTATAILLSLLIYRPHDKWWSKLLFGLYLLFSLFMIFVTESRSTIVSLAAAVSIYLFIRICKLKSALSVAVVLVLVLLVNMSMMLFIVHNRHTGMNRYTQTEKKLAAKSSDRYTIWKATFLSLSTADLFFGAGSLKFVEEGRDEFLSKNFDNFYSYKDSSLEERELMEGKLDKELQNFSKTLFASDLSFMGNIYEILQNKDRYLKTGKSRDIDRDQVVIEEPKKRNLRLERTSIKRKLKQAKLDAIKDIDTHNGYYSIMFCNGIIGLIVVMMILIRRILRMGNSNLPYFPLPILFVIFINTFESALLTERFFPVVILFMIFALGGAKEVRTND